MPKFHRRTFVAAAGALLALPSFALAQQPRIYRIGIMHPGGLYGSVVNGLRDGLKKAGLDEGKQFVFHLRDIRGDLKMVPTIARDLEGEKVDLICSVTTSLTLGVKTATKSVPIVFYAGNDPVAMGLIEQFRRPGGRLTGIYSRNTDILGAKRLELLTQLAPKTRRIVLFSNPESVVTQRALTSIRAAAKRFKLEVDERHARSVEEFRAALGAFRPKSGDAIGYLTDALMVSQAEFVAEVALVKRVPTIFSDPSVVAGGGLASYGESYYKIGLRMANLVRRVMLGDKVGELPVDQLDELHFAVNMKTAKALGLSISHSLLARADEVFR